MAQISVPFGDGREVVFDPLEPGLYVRLQAALRAAENQPEEQVAALLRQVFPDSAIQSADLEALLPALVPALTRGAAQCVSYHTARAVEKARARREGML